MQKTSEGPEPQNWMAFEWIDGQELARRLKLKPSWVSEHVRSRSPDRIPHRKFGRFPRFPWGSPELNSWIARGMRGGKERR